MSEKKTISIRCDRKDIELEVDKILYVLMDTTFAEFHMYGGEVYTTRRRFKEVIDELGDGFAIIRRGCLVSVMAIHGYTQNGVVLINGEKLRFALRRMPEIMESLRDKKMNIIESHRAGVPSDNTKYSEHYKSFDNLPIAFADIELVFNEDNQAVDWVFRYGNEALAKIEKVPLAQIVGNSFSSIFSNMDKKWLNNYERSAIYGETIETIDYSPEVDTLLKIISFPTFKNHCGCILFDVTEQKFLGSSDSKLAYISLLARRNND